MKNFICFTILIALLIISSDMYSQNVGINNTAPTEKLTVSGNLLVTAPVVKSTSQPNAAHTSSLIAGNTDTFLVVTDSGYRIYDPGGTANYSPGTLAGILLADTTGSTIQGAAGGLEISFDSIKLGTGDTIYIGNQDFTQILFRAGSNLNGTHPSFSGNYLKLAFISNADASVGPGFSAIVRRLFITPGSSGTTGGGNYGNAALFFNAVNGSFKVGTGNSSSTGAGAVEIGNYSSASGFNSTAIGAGSQASNTSDMAIAGGSAAGQYSVAIGIRALAQGNSSIALGADAYADGIDATALTSGASSHAYRSTAIGDNSKASGNSSVAIGGGITNENASYAVGIGNGAIAAGQNSIALGNGSSSAGTSAIGIGEGCTANEANAVSLGYHAHADGIRSVALGSASTSGYNATAMGNSNAGGDLSTAFGNTCNANGKNSIAGGNGANTSGNNCVALGSLADATADSSFAIGNNVTASGANSTAMGNYCSTSGFKGSFAIGDNSTTTVMQTFEANAFRARFAKGFRFYTTSAVTIGAYLNQGANSWAALSDVRTKENFLPVNGEAFLKRIETMSLTSWNYKEQDPKTFRHYGPMGQDFFAAFGRDAMGTIGCDTMINQQDFLGVNLIAIQALIKRTGQLQNENTELQKRNDALSQQIALMQQKMDEQNTAFADRFKQLEALVMRQRKDEKEEVGK